jgi:hypothetical protein
MSGDVSGYLNVYIRDGDSLIAHEQYRLIDGNPLDVGYNSFPAVFDWNGDGMKDLIVGSQDFVLRVYVNMTSDTWPMFQDHQPVIAGDTTIGFRHANPCIFDLDEDGRDDLIVGHYGGYVHFFRNVGDDTVPVFEAGESLRFEDGTPVRYGEDFWWHSRCSFGDWDNDGTPDFVMTTRDGTCVLFRGIEQVGVEEKGKRGGLKEELQIPTLTRGVLRVTGLRGLATLSLRDVVGREVLKRFVAGSHVRLELGGLAAGVYLLRVSHEGETVTARVVLARH